MKTLAAVTAIAFAACGGGGPVGNGSAATATAEPSPIVSSAPCEVRDAPPEGHSHGGPSPEALDKIRAASRDGRCTKIHYRSNGLTIAGYVLRPPRQAGAAATKAPAILAARGGNRTFGQVNAGLLAQWLELTDQGFVVIATQYRGGSDDSQGTDEFGGADVLDLENLVPVARALPDVDAGNLFLLGFSRGGMMAAMALRNGLPVRAAVLYSAALDLDAVGKARPEMERNFAELMPDYAAGRDAALRRRSAVHWADELKAPILILAGTRDVRVQYDLNSARLAELLAKAGREHKLVTYDDDHGLSGHHAETTAEIVSWFRSHLAR